MEFQPWFKAYADLPERKAHYSDSQFRAYVELLCESAASRTPGRFPSIAAVRRIVGDVAHFLTEQGDLDVAEDGSVTIHGWEVYQRPVDRTNAARQARHRDRQRDDAVSNATHNALSDRYSPSSTSTSNVELPENPSAPAPARETTGYPAVDADRDSLDVYYELTGFRPWGSWSGDQLRAAIKDYTDPVVEAALREMWRIKPERNDLMKDTMAYLARGAERARLKREPKVTRAVAKVDKERYDAIRAELAAEQPTGEPG